jgi:hypothetical protein
VASCSCIHKESLFAFEGWSATTLNGSESTLKAFEVLDFTVVTDTIIAKKGIHKVVILLIATKMKINRPPYTVETV